MRFLSPTMLLSIQWSLKIQSKETFATLLAEKGCCGAQKCSYFDNMSTTTKISVLLSNLINPSMKSMDMSSQNLCEIGIGCNYCQAFIVSPLFCWQIPYFSPYILIYSFIPMTYYSPIYHRETNTCFLKIGFETES